MGMKTVVLAGGDGRRLRPLTCDKPKHLLRLCGRPLLHYVGAWLAREGVTQAAVTVGCFADDVERACADAPLRLLPMRERTPQGTAGCLRVFGQTDALLVVCGDVLTDLSLRRFITFHRQTGADMTVLTAPARNGTLTVRTDGQVALAEDATDAPAGVWLLSPTALRQIPPQGAVSLEQLMAQLLEAGHTVRGYAAEGRCFDVDTVSAYLACQRAVLDARPSADPKQYPHALLRPPVYIGAGVRLENGACVGPYAVLDDGCTVGARAHVAHAAVGCDAVIGNGARVMGAVVCRGAQVQADAVIEQDAAVGAGGHIGQRARVGDGVRVWAGRRVADDGCRREHLRFGGTARFERGFLAEPLGEELTAARCARLGAAVGSVIDGEILVSGDGSAAARALCPAVAAGAAGAGCTVWDIGGSIPPQFRYLARESGAAAGIRLCGGPNGGAHLWLRQGTVSAVEERLADGDFRQGAFGTIADCTALSLRYRHMLTALAARLDGRPEVRGADSAADLLREVLETAPTAATDVRLHLGWGGERVSIYTPQTGMLDPAHVTALLCCALWREGRAADVPKDAPYLLDALARACGGRLLRGGGESMRDGLWMGLRLLSHCAATRCTLRELAASLPPFAVVSRTARLSPETDERLHRLLREGGGEALAGGIRVATAGGAVTLRRVRASGLVTLAAEAAHMEAAEELCSGFAREFGILPLDNAYKKA